MPDQYFPINCLSIIHSYFMSSKIHIKKYTALKIKITVQTSGNNLIPFNSICPQNLATDKVKSMSNFNCSKVK